MPPDSDSDTEENNSQTIPASEASNSTSSGSTSSNSKPSKIQKPSAAPLIRVKTPNGLVTVPPSQKLKSSPPPTATTQKETLVEKAKRLWKEGILKIPSPSTSSSSSKPPSVRRNVQMSTPLARPAKEENPGQKPKLKRRRPGFFGWTSDRRRRSKKVGGAKEESTSSGIKTEDSDAPTSSNDAPEVKSENSENSELLPPRKKAAPLIRTLTEKGFVTLPPSTQKRRSASLESDSGNKRKVSKIGGGVVVVKIEPMEDFEYSGAFPTSSEPSGAFPTSSRPSGAFFTSSEVPKVGGVKIEPMEDSEFLTPKLEPSEDFEEEYATSDASTSSDFEENSESPSPMKFKNPPQSFSRIPYEELADSEYYAIYGMEAPPEDSGAPVTTSSERILKLEPPEVVLDDLEDSGAVLKDSKDSGAVKDSEVKKKAAPLIRTKTEKGFVTLPPTTPQKRQSTSTCQDSDGAKKKKVPKVGGVKDSEAPESSKSMSTSLEASEVPKPKSTSSKPSTARKSTGKMNRTSSEDSESQKMASGAKMTSSKAPKTPPAAPEAPKVQKPTLKAPEAQKSEKSTSEASGAPKPSPTSSESFSTSSKPPKSGKSTPEASEAQKMAPEASESFSTSSEAPEAPNSILTSSEGSESVSTSPKAPEAFPTSSESKPVRKSAPLIRLRTYHGVITLNPNDFENPPKKPQKRRSGSINDTEMKKKKVGGAKSSESPEGVKHQEAAGALPEDFDYPQFYDSQRDSEADGADTTSSGVGKAPGKGSEVREGSFSILEDSGAPGVTVEDSEAAGANFTSSGAGKALLTSSEAKKSLLTSPKAPSLTPEDSGAPRSHLTSSEAKKRPSEDSEALDAPSPNSKDSGANRANFTSSEVGKDSGVPKVTVEDSEASGANLTSSGAKKRSSKDSEAPKAPSEDSRAPEVIMKDSEASEANSTSSGAKKDSESSHPTSSTPKPSHPNTYTPLARQFLKLFAPPTPGASALLESFSKHPISLKNAPEAVLVPETPIQPHQMILEMSGDVSLASEASQNPTSSGFGFAYDGCVDPQDPSQILYICPDQESESWRIRKSCRPNTILKHVVTRRGTIRIFLVSTMAIEKGAELMLPLDGEEVRIQKCALHEEGECPRDPGDDSKKKKKEDGKVTSKDSAKQNLTSSKDSGANSTSSEGQKDSGAKDSESEDIQAGSDSGEHGKVGGAYLTSSESSEAISTNLTSSKLSGAALTSSELLEATPSDSKTSEASRAAPTSSEVQELKKSNLTSSKDSESISGNSTSSEGQKDSGAKDSESEDIQADSDFGEHGKVGGASGEDSDDIRVVRRDNEAFLDSEERGEVGGAYSPEFVSMDSDEDLEILGKPMSSGAPMTSSETREFEKSNLTSSDASGATSSDSKTSKSSGALITSSEPTSEAPEALTSSKKDSESPKVPTSSRPTPEAPESLTSSKPTSEASESLTSSKPTPESLEASEPPKPPTSSPESEDIDILETWDDQQDALDTIRRTSSEFQLLNNYTISAYEFVVARLQEPSESQKKIQNSIDEAILEKKVYPILEDSVEILISGRPMDSGDIVTEMVGHVEMADDVENREIGFRYSGFRRRQQDSEDSDEDIWITPTNDTRCIRRSCQPNAVLTHTISESGGVRILVVARTRIEKFQEVTLQFDDSSRNSEFCRRRGCAIHEKTTSSEVKDLEKSKLTSSGPLLTSSEVQKSNSTPSGSPEAISTSLTSSGPLLTSSELLEVTSKSSEPSGASSEVQVLEISNLTSSKDSGANSTSSEGQKDSEAKDSESEDIQADSDSGEHGTVGGASGEDSDDIRVVRRVNEAFLDSEERGEVGGAYSPEFVSMDSDEDLEILGKPMSSGAPPTSSESPEVTPSNLTSSKDSGALVTSSEPSEDPLTSSESPKHTSSNLTSSETPEVTPPDFETSEASGALVTPSEVEVLKKSNWTTSESIFTSYDPFGAIMTSSSGARRSRKSKNPRKYVSSESPKSSSLPEDSKAPESPTTKDSESSSSLPESPMTSSEVVSIDHDYCGASTNVFSPIVTRILNSLPPRPPGPLVLLQETRRFKRAACEFQESAECEKPNSTSSKFSGGATSSDSKRTPILKATDNIYHGAVILEALGDVAMKNEMDSEDVDVFKNSGQGRYELEAHWMPKEMLYGDHSYPKMMLCLEPKNEARFVRRSCLPNAHFQHAFDTNSNLLLFLVATRAIQKGLEITVPFDSDWLTSEDPIACQIHFNSMQNCSMERKRLMHAGRLAAADVLPIERTCIKENEEEEEKENKVTSVITMGGKPIWTPGPHRQKKRARNESSTPSTSSTSATVQCSSLEPLNQEDPL